MSKLETLLDDGLGSELSLQEQLKALSEALRQQLQETERIQREELDKRIHQNDLLSPDHKPSDKNELDHQNKRVETRRSTVTTTHTKRRDKETLHHLRQSERFNSGVLACPSSTNQERCLVRTSTLSATETPQCEQEASSKSTRMRQEEENEAECQKKFCALLVPSHVSQPLYQELMELKEKERKQGHEQRRLFLLSNQKPFSFQKREKEKREKLKALLNQVSDDGQNKVTAVRKSPRKEVKDSPDSDLKVQHKSPTVSDSPKLRTAERTRREKLGFLYEKPSFHPKINHEVPDFSRLHKAMQTAALRKTRSKDVTKCQPFCLRTSDFPARKSRMSPENSQAPKISNVSGSKSSGAVMSLSTDTLPIFITDAVRKRCVAIRKSMEVREMKNQESTEWLRTYQMRSQAMRKSVALHAKLLDPQSNLKEVHDEKLQHHRAADQQRMREYTRELREIKARVSERPFLFEQVTQKNAKAHVEQKYRNKLKKAGIKEQFVKETGDAVEGASSSSGSEDESHNKKENVDNWDKIEDVKEKSMKSEGEEMP